MSTSIVMALVMNILHLLFSPALVRSDQHTVPVKSLMIRENITYECIDIYKQPGLDHPLLKNHTIQIKPSASRSELNYQIGNKMAYKNKIGCPYGTVPVLINTKVFITDTQPFIEEKYFHPLSAVSPGTHIAGVRVQNGPYHGVKAWFDSFSLKVGKGQASRNHIFVGSRSNNEVNFISTGWMIDPDLYGDGRLWTYGFWKGKDGNGCYNTICPGFVQVSQNIPIAAPADFLKPGEQAWMHWSIHRDAQTGNWWVTQLKENAPNEDIGYWPKELFDIFDNGANMAGAGGSVKASPSGLSPPMGNGEFPQGHRTDASVFGNIEILNSNYEKKRMDSSPIEIMVDSPNCYGLKIGHTPIFHINHLDFFFNCGGPGGDSC